MSRPVRGRGGPTAWFLAFAFLIGLAGEGAAHDALRRSVPANGALLDEAPRELRLTFTRAIDPALARVELIDADGGAVDVAPPAADADAPSVLVVAVTGPLRAGAYTVRWRIVGSDGHPVQGTFGFEIAEGAAGLAPSSTGDASQDGAGVGETPASHSGDGVEGAVPSHPGDVPGADPSTARRAFDVNSPAYVAIRWFTFLCLLGLIGSVTFRAVVLGGVARRGGTTAAVVEDASDRARVIGMALGWVLLVAGGLRLVAQVYALGGLEAGLVGTLITGTAWGRGWMLQVAATVLALVGLGTARGRGVRVGWGAAAFAAAVLAVTPALSGHAMASRGSVALAVAADALHVIGAGGWLGTLALIVAAGIPAAMRLDGPVRGPAVASMIGAFSPAALCFAAVLAATGLYASVLHVGSLAALFESAYGRTLLIKLAAIAAAFGMGAYNLLRVKPVLGDEAGIPRLRRSSTTELAAGGIVLVATALLVATPPATDAAGPEEPPADVTAPVGAVPESGAPRSAS